MINRIILILSIFFKEFVFAGLFDDEESGAGTASSAEVGMILKALQANEGTTDIATLSGGSALQIQSLEKTLANLTFKEDDLKFWKSIGKEKAFSTLEEYSIQDAYGSEGSFVGQLENSEEDDPEFDRAFAVMKYMRQIWRVSDVLQMTGTISDAEVLSVQGAIMRCLRDSNKALYFGNSAIVPQQFDGILKVIEDYGTTDHIVDLRGADVTEHKFRDGAQLIQDNYGMVNECYLSLGGQTSIDNILLNNSAQRYMQNAVPTELGAPISSMRTSFGNFVFKADRFLNVEGQTVPTVKVSKGVFSEGATSKKAPAMPSITVTAVGATIAGSLWATTGSGGAIAGIYKYRVSAINNYGKSIACAEASATVVASGAIDVAITAGSNGNATYGYDIFRETAPASGVFRFMKTVKNTATVTTHRDLNANLPGTGIMILVDNTPTGADRSMVLSQLAPLHRTQYAKVAPYKWGAINYYITPKWYAPKKFVLYRNVKISETNRSVQLDI